MIIVNRAVFALFILQSAAVSFAQNHEWISAWRNQPSNESWTEDRAKSICVDRRGNSYVAGPTDFDGSGIGSGLRIAVVKYDLFGSKVWERILGPTSATSDLGNLVTDDLFVYVSTTQPHSGTGKDIYAYKLNVGNGEGGTATECSFSEAI